MGYFDYYDLEDLFYAGRDTGTALIIAFVIGLILTVLLFIFVIPEHKRAVLNSFFKKVHDFFTIKGFWLESIAKFFFVLASLFCVFFGIAALFVREISFLFSLVLIILGPIIQRLSYEGVMLIILLVRNTMDIRNFLRGVESEKMTAPKPEDVINNVVSKIKKVTEAPNEETGADAGAPTDTAKVFCKYCGKANAEDSSFCESCGKPLN